MASKEVVDDFCIQWFQPAQLNLQWHQIIAIRLATHFQHESHNTISVIAVHRINKIADQLVAALRLFKSYIDIVTQQQVIPGETLKRFEQSSTRYPGMA